MIARRRIGRRLVVAMVAVFALLAVFIVRLVDIQVVQAEALTKAAQARQEFQTTVYGTRGEIVDTNGVVLAASVDRFDITASPRVAKIDGYIISVVNGGRFVGTKKLVRIEEAGRTAAVATLLDAEDQPPEADVGTADGGSGDESLESKPRRRGRRGGRRRSAAAASAAPDQTSSES